MGESRVSLRLQAIFLGPLRQDSFLFSRLKRPVVVGVLARLDLGQLIGSLPLVAGVAIKTAKGQMSHLSDDQPDRTLMPL
jgi:hypothetical protein